MSDTQKPVLLERPVPLPRQSLLKPKASPYENFELKINTEVKETPTPEAKDSTTGRKVGSRILLEKIRMKNEVQKIEKSFNRLLVKRRSVAPEGNTKIVVEEDKRSASLPGSNIFDDITFTSPIDRFSRFQTSEESDEASSDTESPYTLSEQPPPYPPPPLPDESTYDELTSTSSEGRNSYYSPCSDINSIYEELSSYLSLSGEESRGSNADAEASSSSQSGSAYGHGETSSRYEVIEEPVEPKILIPEMRAFEMPVVSIPCKAQSIVSQFDPLFGNRMIDETVVKKEETVLKFNPFEHPEVFSFWNDEDDGSYGKIENKHQSILSDCVHMNYELPTTSGPPPVPPRRFDSVSTLKVDETLTEVDETTAKPTKDPEKRSSIIRWSSMKKVARFVAENIENSALSWKNDRKVLLEKSASKENNANEEMEDGRHSLYSNEEEDLYVPLVLHHSGVLYRPGGLKRWGVLAQRKLTIFSNKDSPDVKETINVDSILSLRTCTDNRISVEGEQVSCFEVSLSGKSQAFLLGSPSPSERHVWMRKLLESVTPAFPAKLALDYVRAGWCYFKDGISSSWNLSSVLLRQRSLHLVPRNGADLTADLRKARFIILQENDQTCKKASEKGPLMVVDLQDRTLYLQMDTIAETSAWETAVKAAALHNGPDLADQQLTKDDVPTLVDKCINFVHTHGSVSEGIYRRNGSSSAIGKLLSIFRRDAWSVQLTRQDYSEFDVSSVLKRFFRDLPEPLFIPELHQHFREIVESATVEQSDKLEAYKELLKKLPRLNYLTARRLMGHLYFIDKLREKNLMPAENLSAIWGPTLMHVQEGISLDPNWSRVESTVVNDLITHYPKLFDVSDEELQREMKILSVLENFHSNSNSGQVVKKPSGDLKVWIYLNSQQDCVSVEVTPSKLARELCVELSPKMRLPGHALCLQEEVCGGQLRRPLHHAECVLDTILRWGYWPEEDRRDNRLLLTPATFLQDLLPLFSMPLLPAVEELKFADNRSKNFKTYLFELSQTALCYYKDKTSVLAKSRTLPTTFMDEGSSKARWMARLI